MPERIVTTEQDRLITFSAMLKGYRKDTGLTMEHLSKKVGCTKAYIGHIEHGRSLPSLAFVEKFVAAMRMGKSEARIWHRLGAEAHGWRI